LHLQVDQNGVVYGPYIWRSNTDRIRSVSIGKHRQLAGIHRKKSKNLPAGILLPFPRNFRCFPTGYGDFSASFLQDPAGSCRIWWPESSSWDVNPLRISYEILGGTTGTIIPCNTLIPYQEYNIFTTAYSNQRIITFKVLESESSITRNNHILDKFDLTGIQCAEQGVLTIEINFFINVSGILTVSFSIFSSLF
jgi:hypothetical protein